VERCRVEPPRLRPVGGGHIAACHLAGGDETGAPGGEARSMADGSALKLFT
jgi:hypothetical protein